jgi:hypothetical protein
MYPLCRLALDARAHKSRTARKCDASGHPPLLAKQQHYRETDSMTVSITIRDVPNETRDVLASRAALSGRSLQEYLSLQLRELAARPDLSAAIASIRERAHEYPRIDAAEILAQLDVDRR